MRVGRGKLGRVAIVALAVGIACSAKSSFVPPLPTAATVGIGLDEYRFDYKAPQSAGRVVFRVENVGTLEHEMVLIPLPEDLPPLEEQLRSANRTHLGTLAHLPPRAPGERGTFAVDLTGGRYGMICFLKGPDGSSHASKGMVSEFRI